MVLYSIHANYEHSRKLLYIQAIVNIICIKLIYTKFNRFLYIFCDIYLELTTFNNISVISWQSGAGNRNIWRKY